MPLLRSPVSPVTSVVTRSTHTTNVTEGQNSSIPARAESHGYSPFKVDFKENKVEWALARVDDLVNWGRKVRMNWNNVYEILVMCHYIENDYEATTTVLSKPGYVFTLF